MSSIRVTVVSYEILIHVHECGRCHGEDAKGSSLVASRSLDWEDYSAISNWGQRDEVLDRSRSWRSAGVWCRAA